MRALIRNTELYAEDQWSPFTQNHLTWHRTANPDGDDYALAEDAPADAVASDFDISQVQQTIPAEEEGAEARTMTLLTATLNAERYNARKAREASE